MLKRIISEIMLIMLLIGVWTFAFNIQPVKAAPTTWTVDDDRVECPDANFTSIQEAINAASEGDIVKVYNGTYVENVEVDKKVSLIGQNPKGTTIYGNRTDKDTVKITASGCVLENFTITNGGQPYMGGLRLSSSNSIVRYNNICTNRDDGIYVDSCNNTVANNTISHNKGSNIVLGGSYNLIANNSIEGSTGGNGIFSTYNNNNIITNNVISGNLGIILGNGIYLMSSSNNTIMNNKISENEGDGIHLINSSGNVMANNEISLHKKLSGPTGGGDGVYVENSNENFVHHNRFINNTYQATSIDSTNVWDDDYPSGGNYWSDFNGTDLYSGPYQNVTGSDLIIDEPYNITDAEKDCYPLITEIVDAAVVNVTTDKPGWLREGLLSSQSRLRMRGRPV